MLSFYCILFLMSFSNYKEDQLVATSTFERKIVIEDAASREKLRQVFESEEPAHKLTKPLFSTEERKQSERLLAQCLIRSMHGDE